MKKLLCILILVAFFGSTLVMTGCSGGGDGVGAILGAAVFILAISASGPGGAAVFAANNRTSLRPAISIATNNVNMKVTPLNLQGTAITASAQTIASASITFDNTNSTFNCNANIPTTDGYNQYLVEVFAGNTLILKCIKYIASSQKNGAQIAATVNTTTTAEAMTYEKWKVNAATAGATSYNYADFTANQATADKTNFNTLKGNIDTQLTTNGGSANLGAIDATAAALSVSNTVPGEVIVVRAWGNAAPMVYRNHEIFFANNSWGPADSKKIGLSFIAYWNNTAFSYRLANYFHFYPETNKTADTTTVVAYAGNGINLDAANTVPTTWYTNSYQAKGSEMAANDVYYFRVSQDAGTYIYGAIKIDSIDAAQADQANLYFHYKYNRNPGSTNLTIQ